MRLSPQFEAQLEALGLTITRRHVASTGSAYVDVRRPDGRQVTLRFSDHWGHDEWSGRGEVPLKLGGATIHFSVGRRQRLKLAWRELERFAAASSEEMAAAEAARRVRSLRAQVALAEENLTYWMGNLAAGVDLKAFRAELERLRGELNEALRGGGKMGGFGWR